MFGFFKERIKNYCVGEIILFGKYPQKNGEDYSPIEWRILDIYEDIALLISEYAIIPSGYCNPDEGFKGMEWINSLARKVCNNDFYNIAFSEFDKHIICKRATEQINITKPTETISCEDDVFILSEAEVIKYFSDITSRLAKPTKFAIAKGCRMGWSGFENYTSWWIMPHYEQYNDKYTGAIYPKAVFHNGEIQYHSRNAYHSDFTIRPCIQIDLNAYKRLD